MTEYDVRCMCKFAVEYGNKPLTREQKEFLKQAIDSAQSWEQLAAAAITFLGI